MSSSTPTPQTNWQPDTFELRDDKGYPIPVTVFPYPQVANVSSAANATLPPASVRQLCTLPPADVAPGMSPNVVERRNGCTSGWSFGASPSRISVQQVCAMSDGKGDEAMNPQCIWEALTRVPNSIDLQDADTQFCLPLDDPTLLANNDGRPLVPVPIYKANSSIEESFRSLRPYDYRMVPVLKHYLESRNHSAANSPMFANITVRPAHKRLRLGVCVAFPPVGSLCDMSAIDKDTGSVADGWLFPGGLRASYPKYFDVALARPLAAHSALVGASLSSLDQVASRSSPPYPFLTYRTAAEIGPKSRNWSGSKAWAIPLVACLPSSANSTLGVVRPLIINGTCASNRECLSGVCNPDSNSCDNSIKPETGSPFARAFMSIHPLSRPLAFPSNPNTRQILEQYAGDYKRDELPALPASWVYYRPLIALVGAMFLVLVAACVSTDPDGRWIGGRWMRKWRTTTERDVELKPVSGRMVADLEDEAAVEEAMAAAAREELPVYVEVRDGEN